MKGPYMLAASPNWRGTYPMSSANGPAPIISPYGHSSNGLSFGNMNAPVSLAPVHKLDPIGSRVTADAIIMELRTLGHNEVAIAGGYARDTHFNRAPRDIDIVVGHGIYQPWSIAELHLIRTMLDKYGVVEEHISYNDTGNPADSNDAITCCFKLPEYCIDIILYSKDYHNIHRIIEGFDANINQFILDVHGNALFLGQTRCQGSLQLIEYPSFRPSAARYNKVIKIAKEVGW